MRSTARKLTRQLNHGIWSDGKRNEYGVIVTAREQETRELWSLHEPGKRMDALRFICERLDRAEGDWRVICYSNPATIVTDLNGTRNRRSHKNGIAHLECIEANSLSKIGRLDLLDPELDNGHGSRAGKRRVEA